MTSLLHLTDKRLEQLNKEEQFDLKLIKLYKKCPQYVIDFLFKIRSINRISSTKLYKSNFFNYSNNIDDSLKIQDEILNLKLTCSSIKSINFAMNNTTK